MKKKIQHPKGGPFGSKKSNMALVGPNLHSRTILQKQISFICMKAPRTELVPPLDDYRPTLLQILFAILENLLKETIKWADECSGMIALIHLFEPKYCLKVDNINQMIMTHLPLYCDIL